MEEKTCVDRLESTHTTEAEQKQQIGAKRRETIETVSRQLSDGEDAFQILRSRVVAIIAERDDWYNLASETSEKLGLAEAEEYLQSSLRAASLEVVDTNTAGISKLQVRWPTN